MAGTTLVSYVLFARDDGQPSIRLMPCEGQLWPSEGPSEESLDHTLQSEGSSYQWDAVVKVRQAALLSVLHAWGLRA